MVTKIQIAKINVDENQAIPAKFGIRAYSDLDIIEKR
jgi:thioredoxin-like negative regulator of GroEL